MSVASAGGSLRELERLRASADVQLVAPGDAGFDEAKLAWNRAHEHHPRAVAIALSTNGVLAVVLAAHDAARLFDHGLDVLA